MFGDNFIASGGIACGGLVSSTQRKREETFDARRLCPFQADIINPRAHRIGAGGAAHQVQYKSSTSASILHGYSRFGGHMFHAKIALTVTIPTSPLMIHRWIQYHKCQADTRKFKR